MKITKRFSNLFILFLILLSFAGSMLPVKAAYTNTPAFDEIQPFVIGSNQVWALEVLSQFDNSEEKIRLYDFLLRAYTYLMIYDERDYLDEYYHVKGQWLNLLEEGPDKKIRQMIDDEDWTIDIMYPLGRPFNLTPDEFRQVFFLFQDGNPLLLSNQMFICTIHPVLTLCDLGLTPGISISAYWAFAERRQKAYDQFINSFDTLNPPPWRLNEHRSFYGPSPLLISVFSPQGGIIEDTGVTISPSISPVYYRDDQGNIPSSQIFIFILIIGLSTVAILSLFIMKGKVANKKPEVSENREPEAIVVISENRSHEMEKDNGFLVTVTCNSCGARITIAKGKGEKCSYCDCIVRE